MSERATTSGIDFLHSFHPYPCKFPDTVARTWLPSAGAVLDPYCGSGTTLLEAALSGHSVVGVDCNPIATLIARAKLLPLETVESEAVSELMVVVRHAITRKTYRNFDLPNFSGRDHWFSPQARMEFGFLRSQLDQVPRGSDSWTFLAASLSAIVTRFSNQDSETRYARVERSPAEGVIISAFVEKVDRLGQTLIARGPLTSSVRIVDADFGNQDSLMSESIDAVITSPPYANTMDYYLYHKQRMNVLGFDFKRTQNQEIGSRHEFSSKKEEPSKWSADLLRGVCRTFEVLRPGGFAVFVIGDSQIAGKRIDAANLLCQLGTEVGFRTSVISSEPMTGKSKLFSKAFQAPNKFEHTVKLEKPTK